MKAAQKPCIFLENAVCLLVPNETDNGACLTVTRFPQGHIAQKFRDLTKRSLFCVRSSFEPQAHDSLGISALSGSWESRLVLQRGFEMWCNAARQSCMEGGQHDGPDRDHAQDGFGDPRYCAPGGGVARLSRHLQPVVSAA